MWENVAVGAIVVVAALYALWYWMPGALRRRLGTVRPELAQKPGCGSCSDCGGCAAPAAPTATDAADADPEGRKPVWMASQR